MVLVTLWTTRRDTQRLELCSAQLCRALTIPHSWNLPVTIMIVLGRLEKRRAPTEQRLESSAVNSKKNTHDDSTWTCRGHYESPSADTEHAHVSSLMCLLLVRSSFTQGDIATSVHHEGTIKAMQMSDSSRRRRYTTKSRPPCGRRQLE